MTIHELRAAQLKLAYDIAEVLREHKDSYFEQAFLEQFPSSDIPECEIEQTQRKVGKIMKTFRDRKMIRQSSRQPKAWELKIKQPDRQQTLFDMHGYPD